MTTSTLNSAMMLKMESVAKMNRQLTAVFAAISAAVFAEYIRDNFK